MFFDALDIEYQYEPEGFELNDKCWYLPDFYLPEQDYWLEIKPAIKGLENWPEHVVFDYIAGIAEAMGQDETWPDGIVFNPYNFFVIIGEPYADYNDFSYNAYVFSDFCYRWCE